MVKTIWIVNYYSASPDDVGNIRHVEFAKHLQVEGWNVRVFSAIYNIEKQQELFDRDEIFVNKDYNGLKYTHIRVPSYVGNGLKRMFSIYRFALLLKKLRKIWEHPDIIYFNEHAPFDYPIVKMAKKLKARLIVEAWDLWPHDFATIGLIRANNPLLKIAYSFERKMYEAASDIVYTFQGGIDYIRMQKWTKEFKNGKIDPERVHYINNGILLKEFYENVKLYKKEDDDLNSEDKFKVIYLGSINYTNNVKQLIDAAAILSDNSKYLFLIYGNGVDRNKLIQYVVEKNITNVTFKEEYIPYRDCAYVVSHASLNIMNYRKGFADWGVSSGKMFQYMAAGKPILCNIKINYSDIEKYGCGIDRDLETPQDYADAIRYFAELPKSDYDKLCANAMEAAKEFDYDYLAKKLIKILDSEAG